VGILYITKQEFISWGGSIEWTNGDSEFFVIGVQFVEGSINCVLIEEFGKDLNIL
jgi:hypothetical protein